MSYFNFGVTLDATVVHIMDHFGAHGCYLLNIAGGQQIRNVTISLIRELQREFSCYGDNVYYIGVSKGATTAISYALMLGEGSVICGEPQIMLGDFIYSERWKDLEQWRGLAYAIVGRVDPGDRGLLNNLFLEIFRRYGSRYSGKISVHVGSTGYYENHVRHLVAASEELGISEKAKVIKHDFMKHDEVIPVFLEAVFEVLKNSEHLS